VQAQLLWALIYFFPLLPKAFRPKALASCISRLNEACSALLKVFDPVFLRCFRARFGVRLSLCLGPAIREPRKAASKRRCVSGSL
jgi:hypothetical protein